MISLRFQVAAAHAGRADKAVAAQFPGASRKQIAALFERGAVRVNGRVAHKGDHVPAGAELELARAPAGEAELRPVAEPALELTVLHEDAELVAMNKPAGMPSHPLRPDERGTLANALVARFPECATAGRDAREAGLIHRLDTGTSGVIVAARTAEAWQTLRQAFAAGTVHKVYWALVVSHDVPVILDGSCELPVLHRGKRMVAVDPGTPGALPAATHWHVIERLGRAALLECTTSTGRMHQVRVHLAWAGTPIVGDPSYGGPAMEEVLGTALTGHFLHARAITLPHPRTGQRLTLEAPLPAERQAALTLLRA